MSDVEANEKGGRGDQNRGEEQSDGCASHWPAQNTQARSGNALQTERAITDDIGFAGFFSSSVGRHWHSTLIPHRPLLAS